MKLNKNLTVILELEANSESQKPLQLVKLASRHRAGEIVQILRKAFLPVLAGDVSESLSVLYSVMTNLLVLEPRY